MTTPILNVIEMGSIRNGKGADERARETGTICCLSTTNQPTPPQRATVFRADIVFGAVAERK